MEENKNNMIQFKNELQNDLDEEASDVEKYMNLAENAKAMYPHTQGEKSGTLASDIGYIKAGIDDLKSELRSIKSQLADIETRLAKAEESVKSAHKRIDELRAQ